MTTSALVTWDGHTAGAIAHRCALPHVELFAETDSTLDVAHELADAGAPPGTLVIADSQRAGRGRLGRSWTSPVGKGIWLTMIERPSDARALDVLSLRVGLRIAEALDVFVAQPVRLKWPNDLLVGDAKLGGILTEARWQGSVLGWVAIGVGVNVVKPIDVPDAAGLRAGASRTEVLCAMVGGIRGAAAMTGVLSASELRRFAARDALAGRRVESPARGLVTGIDASGAITIDTGHTGGVEQHRTGTIRFAEGGAP